MLLKDYIDQKAIERADTIINHISTWLSGNGKILDFGSGMGHVGFLISKYSGREINFLDVKRFPFTHPNAIITIYNGDLIPFDKNEFTTSIVIFTLHHLKHPYNALSELIRVTEKNIIVCEDLIKTGTRKEIITETIKDVIANFFYTHISFQYKTEMEWEELFIKLGLEIQDKTYFNSRAIFNFDHVAWQLYVE